MRKKREHEAKGGVVSRPSFLQSTTKANHDPDLRKEPKTPDTAIFNCFTVQERIRMFAPWFKTFSTFGKTSACATGSAAFIYLFINCWFARPVRAKKLLNHRSLSDLTCKQAHCPHPARKIFPWIHTSEPARRQLQITQYELTVQISFRLPRYLRPGWW